MNSLRSTLIRTAKATTSHTSAIRQKSEMKIATAPALITKTFHNDAITTTPTSQLPTIAVRSHKKYQNQQSAFSSSSSASSTKDLAAILLRERKEEQTITRDSSISSTLSDLKSTVSKSWTIIDATDNGGGATTRMIRKEPLSNGAKVTLTFHCQDTLVEEEGTFAGMLDGVVGGMDNNNDNDDNEEEEEEELSAPIRFDATVSRAGTTLHLSCMSEDALASIDRVTVFAGDDGDKHNGEMEELFRGPDLEDLPEDVCDALGAFLTEDWGCGVNEDVAAFIAMWADYREQAEYVEWLDGVRKIVE